MHFPEIIGLLVGLTIALLVLRSYWSRIPRKIESLLLLLAVTAVAVRFLFILTGWSTTSPRFNSVLYWLAVAGYELMLVRFSLMRPRWLTSISALILLLPIFGSTLLFPLTGIFDTAAADITSIGGNYIVERSPWDSRIAGHDGLDLVVFYRPAYLPFLRRMVQRSSFSDEQCNSAAATATADPVAKLVHFRCPGHSGSQSAIDLALPLR
jgi:hypothetical protein